MEASRRRRTRDLVRGLGALVQPTFFLPAVGMALFGGLLAGRLSVPAAAAHAVAVALAIYTAHLTDGYVDYYVRGEDDEAALPSVWFRRARRVASACFALALVPLWIAGSGLAAALTAPLWLLALLHAPYLDRHPVPVTVDYAIGVALVLLGGYAAQTGSIAPRALGIAAVYALFLAGTKVTVDQLDYEFDRALPKRTLPVVLGRRRAAAASTAAVAGAGALLLLLSEVGVLPPKTAYAAPLAVAAGLPPLLVDRERAVALQMLLAYALTAALFVTAADPAGTALTLSATCVFPSKTPRD